MIKLQFLVIMNSITFILHLVEDKGIWTPEIGIKKCIKWDFSLSRM